MGATVQDAVWSGWQAVEEYSDGTLSRRRLFGSGLDEIVFEAADVDLDGSLETTYHPLYDSTGNLVALSRGDGTVFERNEFNSYGEVTTRVDAIPPSIRQVLVRDDEVRFQLSEFTVFEALLESINDGTIRLVDEATGALIEVEGRTPEVALPDPQGVTAGPEPTEGSLASASAAALSATQDYASPQRLERFYLKPVTPPAAGTSLRLVVEAEALRDPFGNENATATDLVFPWPSTETVISDATPPEIQAVRLRNGYLELEFTEEPDLASVASAVTLTPLAASTSGGGDSLAAAATAPVDLTWQMGSDQVTVRTGQALSGQFDLEISTTLQDLAGLQLPEAYQTQLDATLAEASEEIYERPDERITPTSSVGNLHGFHGHPRDPETGLVYIRNRYYDPEIGRFISPDPLGYVDGPSMYQFALNNPVNYSDPLGLACTTEHGGVNYWCNPMDEMQISSDTSGWYMAWAVTKDTLGNTVSDALWLNVFADAPHVIADPDASTGEKVIAGGKATGAAVVNLGGAGVVVKAGLGRLAATRPVQWAAQRLSRSRLGQRVTGVLMEDVGVLWRRAFGQADEVVEEAGERLLPRTPITDPERLLPPAPWRPTDFRAGQLDAHFAKHAAEWGPGNITRTAYLKRARSLLSSEPGGDIRGFVRPSGDVLRYNVRTNEFAVGAPDGTIRTLFRPTDGLDYWLREIQ